MHDGGRVGAVRGSSGTLFDATARLDPNLRGSAASASGRGENAAVPTSPDEPTREHRNPPILIPNLVRGREVSDLDPARPAATAHRALEIATEVAEGFARATTRASLHPRSQAGHT